MLTRRAWLSLPLLGVPLTGCARLVPRSAGPKAKAKAPPFELMGHDGRKHSLAELISKRPAVVMFYRGFW